MINMSDSAYLDASKPIDRAVIEAFSKLMLCHNKKDEPGIRAWLNEDVTNLQITPICLLDRIQKMTDLSECGFCFNDVKYIVSRNLYECVIELIKIGAVTPRKNGISVDEIEGLNENKCKE